MRGKYIIAVLITGLMGNLAVADPIQISITGTASSSALGYTTGQSYTFNWLLSETYTQHDYDWFSSDGLQYTEMVGGDPLLFSEVSGDGISGTYIASGAPYTYIGGWATGGAHFSFLAGTENSGAAPMGLTANGEGVRFVEANNITIGDLVFPESYVRPTDFFAGYTGTYVSGGEMVLKSSLAGNVNFTPTSVTIAAVPEPATALSLVLGGLVVAGYRRFFGRV